MIIFNFLYSSLFLNNFFCHSLQSAIENISFLSYYNLFFLCILSVFLEEFYIFMLSCRYSSEHRLRHNLNESLRKQRQLSNRITVLMIDKQRRLKQIERRINQLHHQQEIKTQKQSLKKKIERSFHHSQKIEESNSSFSRNLKKQIEVGINSSHTALLQTKQKWYRQIKKISQTNRCKIGQLKNRELQSNKKSNRRIKLMEIHSKENVRQYWKERVDGIRNDRQKQNQKASQLFQNSMQNISLLEQKQQKLLREIKSTLTQGQYYSNILQQQIEVEPYNLDNDSF